MRFLLVASILLTLLTGGCGGGSTSAPPTFPQAVLSPTSLTFGIQLIGIQSAAQAVKLSNSGSGTLNLASVAVSGDYSQTNDCGTGLAPGSSCTFQIVFNPTASGTRTGTITLNDNSTNGSQQVIQLTGAGSAADLSPTSLTFADRTVGSTSAPQTAMLTNRDRVALSIAGVSASGDYAQSNNCGAALAGGASCTIRVTFTPTWSGSRPGAITIANSDVTFLQRVALSGNGLAATSAVSILPQFASLTPAQTVMFQATAPGGANIDFSVDGIAGGDSVVGTITSSGTYSPPGTTGAHTVTATSSADPTQSASAVVTVTDYAGMFTQHNDNARSGQNLNEIVLTTANVNPTQFGKVFSHPVDGQVYAQPLYVESVNIAGGVHNVVYVATQHDSVYAFDADARTDRPLWQASFLTNGATTVPSDDVYPKGSEDIFPEIGITGTPVVDPATRTLYVISKRKRVVSGTAVYELHLHALDLGTGSEKFGGPVLIRASVPGTGDGNDGMGHVPFDSLKQQSRPALLLLNGVVYAAFGSHGDQFPYHGWLLAYDGRTLKQVAVFNTTPNTGLGAFWQSGAGLAADSSGNIYGETGNAVFDALDPTMIDGKSFGDSVLKFSTRGGGLALADYFTPFDQESLNANDYDLGSGAVLLLPDQSTSPAHLLIGSGKEGTIYLIDRDSMGHFHAGDDSQIVQSLPAAVGGLWSMPAYWQGNVYFGGSCDVLKAFRLFNGTLSSTAVSQAAMPFGYPGATPSVSANGATNGIVWTLQTDGFGASAPAVLHAYDAYDVTRELYNTTQAGGNRDQLGPAVKFTVPTIANGKVYIGTARELDVLGILPQ